MKRPSVIDSGLAILAILSAGFLVFQTAVQGAPPPPVCVNTCTITQDVLQCSSGIYFHFTKETCSMCGGNQTQTWNCLDRQYGNVTCGQTSATVQLYFITNTALCPCAITGGGQYTNAEAAHVGGGSTTNTPIPLWLCPV